VDLVNARIVTDDVSSLAEFYTAVIGPGIIGAGVVPNDFEVDDVDATYARLTSLGVTWVMAPTDQPWGARSAMFRDPDGNVANLFTRHS